MTPSLATLDDAPSLKQREWIQGEPGEDVPCQYSSIGGRLTPATPQCEDMRLEPSLNVTPEGSLADIPAAVDRERKNQVPEEVLLGTSSETTYMEIPDTCVKTVPDSSTIEAPRIIQRPPRNGRNPRCPGRQGPPGPPHTPWTCKAYHSPTAPGYIGHNSFGKYFWNSWPVNVTIG